MATYFISTTGNDTTGNGSESTPWLTLAKFLASSASSDICICAAGTYTFATATITNRTVQAATDAIVIFDGASALNLSWTMSGGNLIDLRFENLGENSTTGCINSSTATPVVVTRCHFYNCVLSNSFGDGSLLRGALAITGCLFYAISRVASTGFSKIIAGANVGFTITNSIFYIDDTPAIEAFFGQYNVASGYTIIVTNCIIVNATGATVQFWRQIGGGTVTRQANYSCLRSITSAPSGTGNITSDPLFYDAGAGNFNLRPTSPCLGTGTLA